MSVTALVRLFAITASSVLLQLHCFAPSCCLECSPITITSLSIVVGVGVLLPVADGFAPPGPGSTRAEGRMMNRGRANDTLRRPSAPAAATTGVWKKEEREAKKKKKKSLPESELVNRRKSPALWRYDLTLGGDDDDDDGASPHVQTSQPGTKKTDASSSASTTISSAARSSSFLPTRPPEIMSPAGGFPQLRAAIANGADSVYLGLSSYSARARASNFDQDELIDAVKLAHASGVKVYVALNTLVFNHELSEVENLIRQTDDAGVDAIIVQDLGITKLVRRVAPRLQIHASTQQTVTSSDGVRHAAIQGGANRVVLGRELSVKEIEMVCDDVRSDPTLAREDVDVETFVHGALCVSYSGQCFSSEAWGGRSANRGQCAQACRLPYGLITDGELTELGDVQYLLSPQDLCGLDHVRGLVRAGVACLKIEGRLKDASYVAATTRAYRDAVDEAWEEIERERAEREAQQLEEEAGPTNADDDPTSSPSLARSGSPKRLTPNRATRRALATAETVTKSDLSQIFSRGQDENYDGLTPGFFDGSQHQRLVRGRSPRHRGVHVGRVSASSSPRGRGLVIRSQNVETLQSLKRGDGLVVDRGDAQGEELGGPIFDLGEVRRIDGNDDDDDGGLYYEVTVSFGRDVMRRWDEADGNGGGGGARGGRRRGGGSGGGGSGGRGGRHRRQHQRQDDLGQRRRRQQPRNDSPGQRRLKLVPENAHVWRTSDAAVDKKMRRLSEAEPPRNLVSVSVSGGVGTELVVTIESADGRQRGVGRSDGSLESAEGEGGALKHDRVRKAVGMLGNTGWAIGEDGIDFSGLEDGTWCPISWIKEARRRAVVDLGGQQQQKEKDARDYDKQSAAAPSAEGEANVVDKLLDDFYEEEDDAKKNAGDSSSASGESSATAATRLSVLARTYEQVDAICDMAERGEPIEEIIIDFLEVDGMREAMDRVRSVQRNRSVRAVVASPRIIKPGECGIWRTLLRLEPDGLLVRSAGLLHRLVSLGGEGASVDIASKNRGEEEHSVRIPELLGDFSLNAANAITAGELLTEGLSRVTAAYDLNANAITELATSMGRGGAARLEVVAHAHMPIFHTEHCVFARFLSKGNSYLDCGHACTRHSVHLRDQTGADNLVLADMGCRNTVFAAQAQSGVHSIPEWEKAGVGTVRVELVDEGPEDAEAIVEGYLGVLSGEVRPSEVWELLKHVKDGNGRSGGVSHGSLRNSVERRAGELA